MRNEQVNTAPPEIEIGAASRGSAGTLRSVRPRARAADHCDFALALEHYGSETGVLVLAGELDLYRARAIEDALTDAIGPKPGGDRVRHLAVDLRLVTFIDSTTLLLFLGASRRQRAEGGHLLVLVGPQTPMTVFEATGFDRLLAVRRLRADRETAFYAGKKREDWSESSAMYGPQGRNHGNNGNN